MLSPHELGKIDADGRVCVDAFCLSCGYNVRTLPANGICPECAQPVGPSLRGELLHFADARWVNRLARGALLILIAIGVSVGLYLLSPIMMGVFFAISPPVPGGPGMPTIVPFTMIAQSALGLGAVVIAMIGFFQLSIHEPAAPARPGGFRTRRFVRYGLWLMPAPIVLGLMATLTVVSQFTVTTAVPAFPRLPMFFWVFMVGAALTFFVGYFLVPLASLRLMSRLMRRVPRPGLVRFAQIEFWGLLVAGGFLLLGYAWMIIAFFIPLMRALPTLTTMPATVPVSVTMTPGAPAAVVNYSYPSGSTPITTPSAPAGVTTLPAGALPPSMFAFGPAFLIIGGLSGLGGCATTGFLVAGIVLLILVQRALARAAREAEQTVADSLAANSPHYSSS
ncbi:MAG: hypothetical protein ABIG44_05395 [Planctomycetota bacterium]